MIHNNPYLNDTLYEELKDKIVDTSITFVSGNIYDYYPTDEFDLINLSNIIEYVKNMEEYKDFIERLPLRKQGEILSYLFRYFVMWEQNSKMRELFRDDHYRMSSLSKEYGSNGILVYQKKI